MLGYDPDTDFHRFNPRVHYRLYLSPRNEGAVVICVQDFDYYDYDPNRFLSNEAFTNEADAEAALDKIRDEAAKVLGLTKRYV